MIKPDMLDALSDEDVQAVRALCDKVLKNRDDDRKAKALDDVREYARVTLAAAGLSLKDLVKAKPVKGPQYKGGHSYQHPTNKALVWNARGQKPSWLRELEADGKIPMETSR